jgi:hypothetical protein
MNRANNQKKSLYLLSNNGQDVEFIDNFLKLILKKLNLGFVYDWIQELIKMVLSFVTSYPLFIWAQGELDKIIHFLSTLPTFSLKGPSSSPAP